MTEIKIQVPSGMEIDPTNTDVSIIKFRVIEPKKVELPKSWKEIEIQKGWYIDNLSNIKKKKGELVGWGGKNIVPTQENAESILALCQLLQLRDIYRQGWKPDWTNCDLKYVIYSYEKKPTNEGGGGWGSGEIFSFQTKEIRDLFLTNFKDLLGIYFKLNN